MPRHVLPLYSVRVIFAILYDSALILLRHAHIRHAFHYAVTYAIRAISIAAHSDARVVGGECGQAARCGAVAFSAGNGVSATLPRWRDVPSYGGSSICPLNMLLSRSFARR